MNDFPRLRADVAAAVTARWPSVGLQWSLCVEDEFRDLCARYRAEPVRLMTSRFGFVVSVVSNGHPLIMRSSPDPHGVYQAQVAHALADLQVAPRVHEVITSQTGTWTVLDRVVPGAPFLGTGFSSDSLVPLAAMLRPIRDMPAPSPNMPSVADWLRARLEDDSLSELPLGFDMAPRSERDRALAILQDLVSEPIDKLCHGDASPWNVLTGPDGAALLIDPRGMAGEVAYDVAVVALSSGSTTP
jgi:streptomycin 6-kinase